MSSDSVEKTVLLTGAQGVRASAMYTPGSATDWVAFDFNIERCPAGTVQATMLFSGAADSAGPDDLYQNSGNAENIAIQLQTIAGQPLGNGKSLTGVIINDGYRYHLRARAYSQWIGPYISIHFLSLNPLLVRRRRYSRGERYPSALCGCHSL
ncbi:fimbrial protein [Yokenella regensburgei]|uniref:fimbrial protein n=1 Tax=Yokenella regensburgei TaxID=158877 RepID=UPI003CC91357